MKKLHRKKARVSWRQRAEKAESERDGFKKDLDALRGLTRSIVESNIKIWNALQVLRNMFDFSEPS